MHKIIKQTAGALAVAGLMVVPFMFQAASATNPPTVSNGSASNVADGSASVTCNVTPNGTDTAFAWITYKKSSEAWSASVKSIEQPVGDGVVTGTHAVTFQLPEEETELVPSTTYNYRCKAQSDVDGSTTVAVDTNSGSFTTTADVVTTSTLGDETVPKTVVDPNTGETVLDPNGGNDPTLRLLHCAVNPAYGDLTKSWAVYKKSSDTWSAGPVYGERTGEETVDIPNGASAPTTVSNMVDSLALNTSYDWRCKVDTSGMSTYTTPTATFTTPAS